MPLDKKKVLNEIRIFLLMVLVISSLRSALADWNDVPTGSMKPTIQEGDRVVVNKLAYDLKIPFTMIRLAKWGDPERGDIVVLFSPADGTRLVKRVIALPGDRLEMIDNALFINGKAVQYGTDEIVTLKDDISFVRDETIGNVRHKVMLTPQRSPHDARYYGPTVVPPGHYFVLGDNRDNSHDSRFIGPIERRRIVGRATAVAFSFDRDRYFKPRFDRFFEGLD
jgi:signal peptidase I